MKKFIAILLALLLTRYLCSCSAKDLTCDRCGKSVVVSESSNMEEDWIIYCAECNEELFGDDPLLGNG